MNVPKTKVELHVHLDGSLRITTIIELAKKKGIHLPSYDPKVFKEYVSLKEPKSLTCFLHCFSYFIPVIAGDPVALERIAYEFCEDKANDGVLYCEARYCPHILANCEVAGTVYAHDDNNDCPPRRVVDSICKGFEQGCKEFGVKIRTILCCMRHKPEWSLEIVDLCEEFRNRHVVGLDIAGDESMGEIPAMKEHVLAFRRAKELGIHRTVHAGEAGPAASVHEAIFLLHAERIGHGYNVLQDPALYKLVINKKIHLELCPTSSIITGAVPGPFHKHPAIKFARDGANFSLNTDDMLVCQTNMNHEFNIAFNEMKFSAAMLAKATFNAARSSFLPPKEKEGLIEELKVIYGATLCSEGVDK
ncbi:adenosine deaminase-like isoform X2 [Xenia sp. Carnegie-2017]|uniref:adenosine deaminase-like isoform X2 n=1 Tax=Xenia sp. Carnegie-2017 TaxID=2897299 RepID=UPI001F048416|nr:adenosine deaminase-like isoform X2 [Xenia sp. Carnegie-2017]